MGADGNMQLFNSEPTNLHPQHIVVLAVDDSQESQEAFQYYAEELHRPDDHVVVTYVATVPATLNDIEGPAYNDIVIKAKNDAKRTEDIYRHLLEKHQIEGRVETELGAKVGRVLIDKATIEHARLIVMGTHHHSRLHRVLHGRKSDYVVHHARCPVMVCNHIEPMHMI